MATRLPSLEELYAAWLASGDLSSVDPRNGHYGYLYQTDADMGDLQLTDAAARFYDEGYKEFFDLYSKLLSGESTDYASFQGLIGQYGMSMNPQTEKWLNDMIANQRTLEAYGRDVDQADRDILREAQQLQALGLSASNVLSTGAGALPGSHVASTDMSNISQQNELQRKQLDAQRKMQFTRSMISLVRGLAAAGIGGGSLVLSRKIASSISNQASRAVLAANNSLARSRGIEGLAAQSASARPSISADALHANWLDEDIDWDQYR